MNLAHWLHRSAQLNGGAPALLVGTEVKADYATFHARAAALAGRLGIAPGDRVGLFMANCPEYLITFYAVWIAGGAVVPINNKLHGREAAWILENSAASKVFVTSKLGAALAPETALPMVDVETDAFADAVIQLTQALTNGLGGVFVQRKEEVLLHRQ